MSAEFFHDQPNASASIKTLEAITGIESRNADVEAFFTFDDATFVRNNIYRKFQKLLDVTDGVDMNNSNVANSIYAYMQEELTSLNDKYEFITKEDLLIISGDFFGYASDGESGASVRYQNHIEIRGLFNGIHIVETPTNKQLLEIINEEEQARKKGEYEPGKKYESDRLTFSPTLQIIDPVFHTYTGDDKPIVDYGTGLTLDIPLIYKNMYYQMVKHDSDVE